MADSADTVDRLSAGNCISKIELSQESFDTAVFYYIFTSTSFSILKIKNMKYVFVLHISFPLEQYLFLFLLLHPFYNLQNKISPKIRVNRLIN